MAVYLLDTTTLTLLQRNHPQISAVLTKHSGDIIGITTVNVEEVIGGWFALLRRAKTNIHEAQATQSLADAMAFSLDSWFSQSLNKPWIGSINSSG
jgi:tRNA(fMet)-specific endonuclease VapC